MSLGIALKNRTSIIVAADHDDADRPSATSRFLTLHNRSVVIISGNRGAVEPLLLSDALPKVKDTDSTAAVAQYIHADLVLKIVPQLATIGDRVEIMVAGIDPVRHTTEPDTFYMDSAKDFSLKIGDTAVTLTGTTAVALEILKDIDIASQTTGRLIEIAKECFTATRLRWPSVVAPRLKLAVLEPRKMQVYDL